MVAMDSHTSLLLRDLPQFDWLMPLAPWEDPDVLSDTLRSLSEQTLQARALVVSVDGQISRGLKEALRASGLPIELHEAPQWQGTGLVLARGLLACQSDIVLRVDADDQSVAQRSEWQVTEMHQYQELAAYGGQLKEVSPSSLDQHLFSVRTVPLSTTEIRNTSYWRNPLNHPTVALRRSLVLAAGNYRSCLYFEDWDLWLRMLSQNLEIRNDYRVLVEARVGPKHLSRRHGVSYLKAEFLFLLRSANEKLIPWFCVISQFLVRLPLRILPKAGLKFLMLNLMRSSSQHA